MGLESTHSNTKYTKGSTEYHTAYPPQKACLPQASDGRPGGVPRGLNTPPPRKPAVLATCFPELSQGTPGTAIGAVTYHLGMVLPRQQCHGGGAESPSVNRWKALAKRARAKAKQWQAQIRRYCLKRMRNHVALTTKLTFGYTRLVTFIIRVSRRELSRKPVLPYGVVNVSVHDRRDALFRRGAVVSITGNHPRILIHPGQLPGNGGPVSRRPTNQYLFFQT